MASGLQSVNILDCVNLSGYIKKMGYKRNNWKKRYAVLDMDRFMYFKNEEEYRKGKKKPLGDVKLTNRTVANAVPGGKHVLAGNSYAKKTFSNGNPVEKMLDNQPFCIEMAECIPKGAEKRTYYFSLESELERLQWVEGINQNVSICFHKNSDTLKPFSDHTARRSAHSLMKISLQDNIRVDQEKNSNNVNWQTVHVVASTGTVSEMMELIELDNGVVNLENSDGGTALHQAAGYGNTEVVELLLRHGANVNHITKNKNTPLHIACLKGITDCARILIENGADINALNAMGNSPLHICTLKETFDHVKSHTNCTSKERWPIKLREQDLERARRIVEEIRTRAFLHVEESDWKGVNIDVIMVHLVASSGRIEEMWALKAVGKDIHSPQPQSGSSPLNICSATGNVNVLRFLLENGAIINARSDKGNTALHVAARRGHSTSLSLLLIAGADKTIKNFSGELPVDVATSSECVALLSDSIKTIEISSKRNTDETSARGTVSVTELLKKEQSVRTKNEMLSPYEMGGVDKVVPEMMAASPDSLLYNTLQKASSIREERRTSSFAFDIGDSDGENE